MDIGRSNLSTLRSVPGGREASYYSLVAVVSTHPVPDSAVRARWDLIALALLAAIFCFAKLDSGSLRTWDEAIYGQVAQEYFQTGDWLRPNWNGDLWFHKPPFAMWFMALGFSVFGVGEGAVRLGSAICGVLGVLGTYGFARRFFGRDAALLSALLLLSTPTYLIFSKLGMLDVPLTVFVAGSLFAYRKGLTNPRWLTAAGVAFATAFMIKGVAALVAPLICLAHVLVHREWTALRSIYLWAGGALALLIIAPWHLLQFMEHGDAFIDEYVGFHVLARSTEALEGHGGGPFFYLGALVRQQYPWFLLSFLAVPFCTHRAWKERDRSLSLLVCWIAVIFGIYTLVATKITWYIMPAYPALALCIGVSLQRVVGRRHLYKMVAGVLLALVLQATMTRGILDLEHEPEVKALSRQARAWVPEGETLYVYEMAIPTALFYVGRHVVDFDEQVLEEFVGRAEEGGELICLTREARRVERLNRAFASDAVEVLDRRGEYHLLRIGGTASR